MHFILDTPPPPDVARRGLRDGRPPCMDCLYRDCSRPIMGRDFGVERGN